MSDTIVLSPRPFLAAARAAGYSFSLGIRDGESVTYETTESPDRVIDLLDSARGVWAIGFIKENDSDSVIWPAPHSDSLCLDIEDSSYDAGVGALLDKYNLLGESA